MTTKPKSGYEKVGGISYLPRMLDKIRLHARGELHPNFHRNLGLGVGGDGMCCAFLNVRFEELAERVRAGSTDDEILQWCLELGGRTLDPVLLMLWNEFCRKLGWNDRASPRVAQLKVASDLSHRDDIQTMFEYFDVDEGRKP